MIRRIVVTLARNAGRAALLPALRAGLPALLGVLLLAGCAGKKKDDIVPEKPVDVLYNHAQDLMQQENYRDAAKAFEEVDREHPYSEWATRAEMMTAYAYYMSNQYDDAITAAKRYIELHPGNKDVPYAYYIVGICYYEQISDIGRDQELTHKAMDAFNELVRRFPDSDYARDAKLKLDLATDHLAGKEMEIGRYYENRKDWVAAINRFRNVVEHYQTTTHVPEALERLVECYLALGQPEEAQSAAAVLGYNFPGSDWYKRSYALLEGRNLAPQRGNRSWLSRLF
jgi:outer membrane protein assembly factor BamD